MCTIVFYEALLHINIYLLQINILNMHVI